MALAVTGCKIGIDTPVTEKTGSITGKAFYSNAEDNSTIQITLDKTDGLRTAAVLNEAGLYNPECYEISATNASNARTIVSYASSPNSREKGICRSVVVEKDRTAQADDIQLTATGSIKGKIILDETETDNGGFIVSIAGTSFMATTASDGSFEIIDVPAKTYNEFLIIYGTFNYFCTTKVTVKANEATALDPFSFSSDEMNISAQDGTSIIWKGSFSSSDQLTNPQYLWAFFNTTDGCSYIYDGEEWTLLASKGSDGKDGKDAAQYTIRTTEVAAGDTNLPDGGIKIEVLKNSVVQETRYISNGAAGEDGEDADQYTIQTTEITPCEDYPDGGLKIEILKNSTVVDTKYITNDATGPQGLPDDEGTAADQYTIRTTVVEAGDTNLPNGGVKIEILKNETVIETKYISNGTDGTNGLSTLCLLTFIPNGGTMPTEYPEYCTYNVVTQLPILERNGYLHVGWCREQDLSDIPVDEISADGVNSAITLYAKWIEPINATAEALADFFNNQWSESNNVILIADSNADLSVIKNAIYNNPTKPVELNLSQTNITSIGTEAFRNCTELTSVTIPSSVTSIGSSAFYGCSKLTTVYYTGTQEQWNAITIGTSNTPLTNATIVYNYTPPQE